MSDKSDGPAFAAVHEILHRPPGIQQSHPAVVNDIAVLIPRVLFIPGLKRKGSVNEIEIQIVEPESSETRLEGRFDALRPVIGVPHLRRNKNVSARNPPSGKSCLQRLANLALIPISFRAIEVSKSRVQRVSSRSDRQGRVGNQRAKAKCRHTPGSVAEWNSRHPQIRRFSHGYTSNLFRVRHHHRLKSWMPRAAQWTLTFYQQNAEHSEHSRRQTPPHIQCPKCCARFSAGRFPSFASLLFSRP